jgi:hypothetical protein
MQRNSSILIAGGVQDPNLRAIISAAEAAGIVSEPLLVGRGGNPSFAWRLDSNDLWINSRRVEVCGAFVRRDVFHKGGADAEYRSSAWFTAVQGWLSLRPRIRLLNRNYLMRFTNKLHTLCLAQSVGLRIPTTVVSNAVGDLPIPGTPRDAVAKPVTGGGYCTSLDELLHRTETLDGVAASPAIIQEKLAGPDVRVFWIDGRCHGFIIRSDAVDYRSTRNRTIEPKDELPNDVTKGLGELMQKMSMDWGAADFKIDQETDALVFLEVNSDPMFSAFDQIGGGVITRGILAFLTCSGDKEANRC